MKLQDTNNKQNDIDNVKNFLDDIAIVLGLN